MTAGDARSRCNGVTIWTESCGKMTKERPRHTKTGFRPEPPTINATANVS